MIDLIYGMHEKCPLDVMPDGWILYIAEVGDSNDPHQGIDLSGEPRARMIRIQWRFGSDGGCYPPPGRRDGFIQRVESLVANTPDCHIFIAGNEPNLSTEGLFEPEYTADMYKSIRVAVQEQPGHEKDIVLLPPIGPWNTEIGYGWIEYFARLIDLCPEIDGFALHTYSRLDDPASITSEDKMDPPYDHLYNGFRTYRDWLNAIPARYADRPVYITETDQNDAWLDENNGWVQAAYAEINNHNQWVVNTKWPTIRALILYRWPKHDKYFIEGKQGVIDDIRAAISHGYTVPEKGEPPVSENLLINGGLEHPHEEQLDENGHPMGTIKVAHSWRAWWYDVAPEYKLVEPQFPNRVKEGATAQQFFKNFDKPNGGLLQIVEDIEPGARYKLTGWVQVWTSGEDDPDYSTGRAWNDIGVNVYGETQPDDSDNIWSQAIRAYDEYQQIELEFVAASDRVTVFCRSVFEWPMRNQNAYWDALELIKVDDNTDPPDKPPPGGGEGNLKELYKANGAAAGILSVAYDQISQMWDDLAESLP